MKIPVIKYLAHTQHVYEANKMLNAVMVVRLHVQWRVIYTCYTRKLMILYVMMVYVEIVGHWCEGEDVCSWGHVCHNEASRSVVLDGEKSSMFTVV